MLKTIHCGNCGRGDLAHTPQITSSKWTETQELLQDYTHLLIVCCQESNLRSVNIKQTRVLDIISDSIQSIPPELGVWEVTSVLSLLRSWMLLEQSFICIVKVDVSGFIITRLGLIFWIFVTSLATSLQNCECVWNKALARISRAMTGSGKSIELKTSGWEEPRQPPPPPSPESWSLSAMALSSRCTSCCNRWASGHRWWAGSGPQTTKCPGLPGWAASPRRCQCGPGRSDPPQSNPGRRSRATWWWSSGQCTCARRAAEDLRAQFIQCQFMNVTHANYYL